MIPDKTNILTPAKLNIFLKVLGKRKDGYHNLFTGVTFINLYDVIEIKKSDKTKIIYKGPFKPTSNFYKDCIIKKTLNSFDLLNEIKLKITIIKNIPVQGGLGSASTNAASIIKWLEKMKLIPKKKLENYVKLGSDIPCCLYQKNCIVMGTGEKIYPKNFPKYYFLLLKPNFSHSTKKMYNKLNVKKNSNNKNLYLNKKKIEGNDFEKIVFKENKKFKEIFNYVQNIDNVIFTRMTGSGSCIYAAFKKKEYAINANKIFKNKFKNLWSIVCENNIP